MSAILERVRAIREAALSGQMASQLTGALFGQSPGGTVRGMVAQRMATALNVPAPYAQSQTPILDVLHGKITGLASRIPSVSSVKSTTVGASSSAPAQVSRQVLQPPKNVKFT